MSGWVAAVPHLAVALLVLFAPGTLVLLAAGAPWQRALTFAPVTSVGLVAMTAIALDLAGLPFRPLSVAAVTVAAAAVVLALHLALRARARRRPDGATPTTEPTETRRRSPRDFAFVGALALAAVLLGWRLAGALGGPERISQTFDAVFHLNTTRYIVETGEGSSLRLVGWATGDGGFYPAAWHDLAALVAFDGDVVGATQALGLVVGAVVWPLSVLTLVQRLLHQRWVVLLGTAALISGLGIFPARMLDYGVLYPFLLGIALMPSLVVVAHIVLSAPADRGPFRGLPLVITSGLGAVGLALAHAGVLLSFLLIVTPLVVLRAWAIGRARWADGRRVSTTVAAVAALVVLAAAVYVVDHSAAIAQMRMTDWAAAGTPSQAVGAWLLLAPHQYTIPWVVAGLSLLGTAVALFTRGLRWLPVAHALLAVPFVFAAGVDSDLSQRITGFWYNDGVRLGALLPVTALPLAAVGLTWLADRSRLLAPLVTRIPGSPSPRRLVPAAVALGTAFLVATTTDGSMVAMYDSLARRYDVQQRPTEGALLTADERELLERLPDLVPEGTRIAANPWDGSGFAYAISGVDVLVPQLGARPTGAAKVVAEGLEDADSDPAVCRAVEELHVGYALDFGPPLWVDVRASSYPGLEHLFRSPAVEPVASVGRARLYKVTACGDQDQ